MDYPAMYDLARYYEAVKETVDEYDGTTSKVVIVTDTCINISIETPKYGYSVHQSLTTLYRKEQFHKKTGKWGKKEIAYLEQHALTIDSRKEFANLTVE